MKNAERVIEAHENVFHDLANLMSIMYAYIQLLEKEDTLGGSTHESTSMIKKTWFSMFKLISDTTDQAKMHRGDYTPVLHNQDIVALIEEIIRAGAPLAAMKNIRLAYTSNVRRKIMAVDKAVLERIMLNLLSNSVKYTPPCGTVEIVLQDKGDSVTMTIRDNGMGIPDDKLSSVFERYRRYPGDGGEGGSGIGLSIVKELLRLLKGDIRVSSGRKGTEMAVELPAYSIEEDAKEYGRALRFDSFESDVVMQIELADAFVRR